MFHIRNIGKCASLKDGWLSLNDTVYGFSPEYNWGTDPAAGITAVHWIHTLYFMKFD
jgi:hypothetical protein